MHPARHSRLRRAFSQPGLPFQLSAFLLGLVLVGLAMDLRQAPSGFLVEWEMASDTGGLVQVFPSGPSGYSADHVRDLEVPSDGAMHVHRAEFEGPPPARIRIDPGTSPGSIELSSIRIEAAGQSMRLDGHALADNVRLLNELALAPSGGPSLRLQSTGTDPYFDFPSITPGVGALARIVGSAALGGLGLLLIAWFAWHRLPAASAGWRALGTTAKTGLAVAATCALVYGLMSVAGLGCGRMACSTRGWAFAVPLFTASLGFLIIGTALLGALRLGPRAVFLPILAGQVAVVVYIYARSLVANVLPVLPITRTELGILVALCGVLLWRRGWRPAPVAGERAWLLVRLALLALVCLVVADRELPRLAMLSTDPDTHAFFARQLERFGMVYRDQGEWGPDAMNYPAGSAALIFGWASLSFLDARNALTALPTLLALLASLAIAEPLAQRVAASTPRRAGLVFVAAIGVTVGGLMFPVYQQFSHMEGTGRLLSIGTVALTCLLLASFVTGDRHQRPAATALMLAFAVFVLTTLNPVNAVPLAILVLAVVLVHGPWRPSALWLSAAVPGGLLMLMMDPYYWSLIEGTSAPTKVVLESRLAKLGVADLLSGWSTTLAGGWWPRIESWTRLMPWHAAATFALPLFAFGTALVTSRWTGPDLSRWITVGALATLGVLLATALLEPLAGDARFYLLPQYFPLAVAQYKAVVLTALAAMIVAGVDEAEWSAIRTTLLAVGASAVVALAVRPSQPMRIEPRQDYCGSMGCVTPSDVAVVSQLEAMVADGRIARIDGELPRVLIPNHRVQAGPETWVFPTGGSRYLALAEALPVAFYYYQGDPDYTTRNYLAHICEGLDRGWLERERIRYVFLPTERTGDCPAAFGALGPGDRVVIQSGDSMLIELAPNTTP